MLHKVYLNTFENSRVALTDGYLRLGGLCFWELRSLFIKLIRLSSPLFSWPRSRGRGSTSCRVFLETNKWSSADSLLSAALSHPWAPPRRGPRGRRAGCPPPACPAPARSPPWTAQPRWGSAERPASGCWSSQSSPGVCRTNRWRIICFKCYIYGTSAFQQHTLILIKNGYPLWWLVS